MARRYTGRPVPGDAIVLKGEIHVVSVHICRRRVERDEIHDRCAGSLFQRWTTQIGYRYGRREPYLCDCTRVCADALIELTGAAIAPRRRKKVLRGFPWTSLADGGFNHTRDERRLFECQWKRLNLGDQGRPVHAEWSSFLRAVWKTPPKNGNTQRQPGLPIVRPSVAVRVRECT